MLFLLKIFPFFPVILFIHCIFLFSFKKWLGPVATLYSSIFIYTFSIFIGFAELLFVLEYGLYFYIDFGRWFFCLNIIDSHLVFCIDSLALLCSVLVMILTNLALYFGIEYMYREAFINRLLYLLNMFATSVIFLFFCYDFFLIIFIWECIGLFSLLLVNFYSIRIYTIKAAMKTYVFSRFSDFFMFLAFIMSVLVFNTTDLSIIFIKTPFLFFFYFFFGKISLHFLTMFAFCIALSGVIKSAQFLFHVWLPDAMEAPTPASALIHSSTLVIAGVFLIIRFSIVFEFASTVNYFLIILGSTTLAFSSVSAIFQNDIKKLVAYSTISQIGYLICGCGFGTYEEVLVYLVIHALNKAFLFIIVGYIVHFFSGNTNMRLMGGVYLYSLDVVIFLLGVIVNLSGLPYSAGFFGKEFLIYQVMMDDFISLYVRAMWFISFFFTPIYMFILLYVVIFGLKRSNISSYSTHWSYSYSFKSHISRFSLYEIYTKIQVWSLSSFYKKNKINYFSKILNNCKGLFTAKFRISIITSIPTVFILFFFWLFFFFLGESFLLLIFNFSSILEPVNSNFFINFKHSSPFILQLTSLKLLNILYFYIFFFFLFALIFINSFKFNFNYLYLNYSFVLDFSIIIFSLILSFFFLI